VEREWTAVCERLPENAVTAYERLTTSPLEPYGQRQFPMRGKLKGFWQYEIGGGDRLHYTVEHDTVYVVSVGPHPTSVAALQQTILKRARRK